jgi:hypothetical protein
MTRCLLLSLAALALASCGGTSTAPTTAASATGGTRYRVGDYVVYRYFGRHIGPEPRLLMEEVVSQEGDRLVLEVTLTEGHTVLRRWQQTVIDDAANREANHVESLCEYQGETCVVLANEGNADLLRMYEGLTVTPDAPPTTSEETEAQHTVGGVEMTCTDRVTHVLVGGEAIDITEIECPDFLWTHAGASFVREDKRSLLQVTVEATGSGS